MKANFVPKSLLFYRRDARNAIDPQQTTRHAAGTYVCHSFGARRLRHRIGEGTGRGLLGLVRLSNHLAVGVALADGAGQTHVVVVTGFAEDFEHDPAEEAE